MASLIGPASRLFSYSALRTIPASSALRTIPASNALRMIPRSASSESALMFHQTQQSRSHSSNTTHETHPVRERLFARTSGLSGSMAALALGGVALTALYVLKEERRKSNLATLKEMAKNDQNELLISKLDQIVKRPTPQEVSELLQIVLEADLLPEQKIEYFSLLAYFGAKLSSENMSPLFHAAVESNNSELLNKLCFAYKRRSEFSREDQILYLNKILDSGNLDLLPDYFSHTKNNFSNFLAYAITYPDVKKGSQIVKVLAQNCHTFSNEEVAIMYYYAVVIKDESLMDVLKKNQSINSDGDGIVGFMVGYSTGLMIKGR